MFHGCFAWLAVPVPAQLYKHRQSAVASVGAEQDSQLEEGGGWRVVAPRDGLTGRRKERE